MRKFLMLVTLLIVSQIMVAQDDNNTEGYVSFSTDPMQMIEGEPKGFQWVLEMGVQDNHGRVGMFYERFDAIEYVSYGIQPSFRLPVLRLVDLSLGTELSVIRRPGEHIGLFGNYQDYKNYMTYAFNGSVSVDLMKRLALFVKADMKRRPDIEKLWQFSGYTGVRVSFL
jgi:hypothetical protein